MVEHCLKEAHNKGYSILHVGCAPPESRPFSERMGFTIHDEENLFGHKILHRKHGDRPGGARTASVEIRFFPERKKHDATTVPLATFTPNAWQDKDGLIQLAERVTVFTDLPEWRTGLLVEIVVNGEHLYFDRAKDEEAENWGIEMERHAFFIDRI